MAMELYNRLTGNLNLEDDLDLMRNKAEALLARVADISTEVTNAELHPAKKRKREVDNWMKNAHELLQQATRINRIVEEVEDVPSSRQRLKNQILQISKDIDELLQQATFPNGLVIQDLASSSLPLVTTHMKGQQFDDNLILILSWLKAGEYSRIGVWGTGGVGKTTLATHIHDQLLHDLGKCATVCWVIVSQDCTVSKLQDKIVKALDQPTILDGADEMKRPAILSQVLKKRSNVVVILDDVWDPFHVEEVGVPTGENGCKLLLTTRSWDVCRRMECQKSVKVETLSVEESWSLFVEKLGNFDHLSPEAKVTAKLVAKKCAGLPLAIKVVAVSMRGICDDYEWNNTLEELKNPTRIHKEMENEVFLPLKLSYCRLNDVVLQKCFLSCALYPEDYPLGRDTLVNLWIMEGHLEGIQSRQKQLDKAHSMLNRLVSACLLDAVDRQFWSDNCLKMHDLIRDMAVGISSQTNHAMIKAGMQLREVPRPQEWTEELTKVSLVHNKIIEIPAIMTPECPNLSCLLLQGNPLMAIPDSFFLCMSSLKFLDLSKTFIARVPNRVSDLESLSAINLFGCRSLTYVPSLAKLTKLRHLNLSVCPELSFLPEGMEKLVNLECLFLKESRHSDVSFGKLTCGLSNIQCLELNSSVKDVTMVDILKLGCLERLTNCYMHDIDNFNTYVQSQHFLQLTFYHILLGHNASWDGGQLHNMCVILDGILFEDGEEPPQLPHNIQQLVVCGCDVLVSSLADALPSLDGLTSLKSIQIDNYHNLDGVECIWSESSCARPTLENLESLSLVKLDNFSALAKGRVELPPGAFSSLQTLSMGGCDKVEKLFTPCLLNGQLRNLEEINVEDCNALKEIFAGADLDDESGGATVEVSRVTTLGLPKLRILSLTDLPRLVSICKTGLLCCKSIEEITVGDCPELKKMPLVDQGLELSPPPRLKTIVVEREWWESLVWDNPRNQHTLKPFLDFFEE